MTFSIDRSRSFLKIEESNLLSLHRSPYPIVPSTDYCKGHLCDAFICVVNEYNLHRVYVALHDQQLKSNFIFIADPFRPDNEKLAAFLLDAQGFLENIGFEMEQVNIDFRSATREVIIKDIRVMREPSLAVQLDAAKMALEGLTAENKEITRKASQEQMELITEMEVLKGRLAAATAVQQAPMVERPANAENSAGSALQVETDALHDDLRTLSEEGEAFRLRLVGAEQELQKAQEELSNVKIMLKSFGEGLKNAQDEARQARKEQKLSIKESELLNEKLKFEQKELDKSRKETEVVRRELQEARESSLHDRVAINDDVEAVHQAATGELKAEINRLMTELAGNDSKHSGEIEVLRDALTAANVSLSVEKAKNGSALQEMDALERNASAELKLLNKKVNSLTAEKNLLEKSAAEIKIKAHDLTDDRKEISFVSQQASFASDQFRSDEAPEYLDFLPDKLLKGIPYSFPTDVVEIYQSYNTIQAAPTGKQPQKCVGFVCLVTGGGQSQVYVAWLMNPSGEVLVCLPERAADGDDSCRQMLLEGIGYFERIGFLIDRVHLEEDPDKRQVQLDKLAVFCRTVTDCAA